MSSIKLSSVTLALSVTLVAMSPSVAQTRADLDCETGLIERQSQPNPMVIEGRIDFADGPVCARIERRDKLAERLAQVYIENWSASFDAGGKVSTEIDDGIYQLYAKMEASLGIESSKSERVEWFSETLATIDTYALVCTGRRTGEISVREDWTVKEQMDWVGEDCEKAGVTPNPVWSTTTAYGTPVAFNLDTEYRVEYFSQSPIDFDTQEWARSEIIRLEKAQLENRLWLDEDRISLPADLPDPANYEYEP